MVLDTSKERRRDSYSFESEKDLRAFFAQTIQKKEIKSIISKVKKKFVPRTNSSPAEAKLQLLKKCEVALVKKMRDGLGVEI